MKHFCLVLFLIVNSAYSQEYFSATYGGGNYEELTKMRATTDGGYVMTGSTDSYGPNPGSTGTNYYVVKTDAAGQQQWATAIGGAFSDFPFDVRQISDGGYVIFGYTFSFGSFLQAMLVRLDSNGQELWTKTFSANSNIVGYSVFEIANGNLILAGSIEMVNGAEANWIAKTDSQGNLIHSYNYQSAFEDEITDIDTTRDGSILLTGFTATPLNYDIFLFKLDTALNTLWYVRENTPAAHGDRAHSICELWNGNILIGGGSSLHESNSFGSDICLTVQELI